MILRLSSRSTSCPMLMRAFACCLASTTLACAAHAQSSTQISDAPQNDSQVVPEQVVPEIAITPTASDTAVSDAATSTETSSTETSSAETSSTESATMTAAPATPNATTATSTATTSDSTIAGALAAPIEYSKGGGRLTADSVRYENGVIIAQSSDGKGVVFQTSDTRVQAERIELDTVGRTLHATGTVLVERQNQSYIRPLAAASLESRNLNPGKFETVSETLRGQNFQYDFAKKTGSLDKAELTLAGFSVSTDQLTINGQRYIARNVVLYPGGLTEADRRKYGTPPFSVRARSITVDATETSRTSAPNFSGDDNNGAGTISPQSGTSSTRNRARIGAKGAFLYLGKTRLLPIPGFLLNNLGAGPRNPQAFQITPGLRFNSVDRVLVTTQLGYGLSANPDGAAVTADIGLSQRLGFRGGLAVTAPTRFGTFSLGLRRSDVVSSQLNDRILLDRTPELRYSSGLIPLFRLGGRRLAGLSFSASTGQYDERILDGNSHVSTSRLNGTVNFTTRGADVAGPYLDLFARASSYGNRDEGYSNAGFEVGYAGKILPGVRGAISYRATTVSGKTPFRFDLVEIRRELRTTFDIQATPRYIIPIDLRYDVDQQRLRDQTFGILRSYKDFAYGVVYQTSRKELRLEIRQNFF